MLIKKFIEKFNTERWADSEPIFRDDFNWQYNYNQLSEKANTLDISIFSQNEYPDEDEVNSQIDESKSLIDAWVQVCTWSISKVGIGFIKNLESISSIDELKSAIKQAYDLGAIDLTKFMVALLCKAESDVEVEVNNEEDIVMNTKGREMQNRAALCEMLETAYDEGRLMEVSTENAGNVYVLLDENEEEAVVALDKNSGEFLFTNAGKNKSNKRQYVSLPLPTNKSYMCSNYTFRIIAEGLLSSNSKHQSRYKEFKEGRYVYRIYTKEECIEQGFDPSEGMMGPAYDVCDINHINGDTTDNRDCNIEVDTKGMNLAHARFMSEVKYHYPDLIETSIDCQGNDMNRWADGVGVSCQQIRAWNSANPNDVIRAFKDKKGEWNSKLTKEQVDRMLTYFGKL